MMNFCEMMSFCKMMNFCSLKMMYFGRSGVAKGQPDLNKLHELLTLDLNKLHELLTRNPTAAAGTRDFIMRLMNFIY